MAKHQGRHDRARGRQKSFSRASLGKYGIFYLALLIILVKSFIFIGIITTKTAPSIDFTKAFPDFPPILVYLCSELLLLSIAFLFKGRGQSTFLILIDILLSFILVTDLCFYRDTGNLLIYHISNNGANLKNLSTNILQFIRPVDFIFIADIPVLIFLAIKNGHEYRRARVRIPLFFICFIISLGYLSITVLWNNSLNGAASAGKAGTISPKQAVYRLSPIGYHIYDIYTYISGNH
jgi:phosphoglycerol transferase MdoB-like AlkP superfamily enzyme